MPVEIGLEMYGDEEVVLPFFTGHVARGLLLHFVKQVDPSASGLLHEWLLRYWEFSVSESRKNPSKGEVLRKRK